MKARNCNFCEQELKGRQDKKFCDDGCRSAFNNKLNADQTNQMRTINNALRRNRRILEELFASLKVEKTRVSEKKILEMGFMFNFHTHTKKSKTGSIYFFCYDYGYMPLENQHVLVIKSKVA